MKTFITIIGCFIFLSTSGQRITVTRVTSATEKVAPFYFLPKTSVALEIACKRVTKEPGPLKAYDSLIGIDPADVIQNKSITYSVDYPSIGLVSKSVFDKNYVYKIDVKKRLLSKNSMALEYLEEGFLKGVDASSESNAIPVITTILSSAAKVVGSFIGTRAPGLVQVKSPLALAEDEYPLKLGVEKKNLGKAILLARSLFDIRSRRNDLVSCCTFGGDIATLQKMLDELQRQEDDIIAVFAGTVETKIIKQQFEITPTDKSSIELFKYDPSLGFTMLRKDTLNIWNPKFDGNGVTHTVTVAFATHSDHLTNISTNAPVSAKGFTYRIPGSGTVTFLEDRKEQLVRQLDISQFGPVVSLPSKLSSSKLEYFTNGGISKLALVRNSVNAEDIEKVGSTVSDIHNKFKKKEPETVDELADLERQRKILEEKLKIDELNKKVKGNQ